MRQLLSEYSITCEKGKSAHGHTLHFAVEKIEVKGVREFAQGLGQ